VYLLVFTFVKAGRRGEGRRALTPGSFVGDMAEPTAPGRRSWPPAVGGPLDSPGNATRPDYDFGGHRGLPASASRRARGAQIIAPLNCHGRQGEIFPRG